MKFCIVSDVHGNIKALEHLIEYIEKENINIILNLGDILGGEYPEEVFFRIINDKRFINVKGNHEEIKWDYYNKKFQQEINKECKEIPLKRVVTIMNKRFLMVHSREVSNKDIPLIYNGSTIEEFLDDYQEDVDYVLVGHTHLPLMINYYGNKTIINPGSLGLSYDNNASFCVCDINESEIDFTFKKIKIE